VAAADARHIARLYRETRERVASIAPGDPQAAVVACPGWTVRDVVAHLTAVAEDWGHGPFTGPPTDEQTAAQLARFEGGDLASLLAAWTVAAARLDHLAETSGLAPPLGDAVVHEHDVRAAVGSPGARDSEALWHASDQLLANFRTPVPLRVVVEDRDYRCGPDDGIEILLRTDRFEALRWRTGRRSRAQLAAMDWSDDPTPVLDHLCLFGPATADVVENERHMTSEKGAP
jgi:uncharacterized protein (TIGR03083 family)